ncbi:MAG: YbbR-like domain-containing protein [Porphyromonadaceae bacterium]|nr:YbbR-like domain-containing protein [Porphyromonadaceae bacterium]
MSEEGKKRFRVKSLFQKNLGLLRTLLRNKRYKEFIIFLLFVALSFLFWIILAFGEEMNIAYRIPIKYTNFPDNAIITYDLPTSLTAHLRDEGTVLMNYSLDGLPALEIDFRQYANSSDAFILTAEEIKEKIKKNLRNTTILTSISIDSLAVYYTQSSGKKVRLRITGTALTIPQCIISGEIRSDIDSVQVYAPEYLLNTISYIETDSFLIKDLNRTVTKTVPLRRISGVKTIPQEVKLTIPVEELTSKTISIPISVNNLPRNVSLYTFPAMTKAECLVPTSQFSLISTEDIGISVDYNDIRTSANDKLALKIDRLPSSVQYITLSPDSVEYILDSKR